MKNLFSFDLYKEGFKKVRILGTCFLIAMVLLNLAGALISEKRGGVDGSVTAVEYTVLSILLVAFVPVLTYSAFSFINNRAASDFYHALPQKRNCVFLSFMAAVVTWIVLLVFAGNLTSYLCWELIKGAHVPFSVAASTFLCYGTMSLVFSACTVLGMMFAGTPTSAVFATNVLIWAPPFLAYFFQVWVERFYPQVAQWHSVFNHVGYSQFMPIRILFSEDGFAIDFGLLLNLLAAAVLIVLACRAYANRKSESATHSVVGKAPRHIIRGAFPFLLLLAAFNRLYEAKGYKWNADGLYLGAVVCAAAALLLFFLYELNSTASMKRTLRAMPWFLTVVAAVAVFVGGAFLTSLCFDLTDPDGAEDIECVTVTCEDYYSRKYSGITVCALLDFPITDEGVISSVYKDFTATEGDYNRSLYCDVKMELRNGLTIWRRVRVTESSALEEYVNASHEIGKREYPIPTREINKNEDAQLWETFKAEYDTLTYGQRKAAAEGGKEGYRTYYVDFKAIYSGYDPGITLRYYVYPENMPKTYKMLKEKEPYLYD